MLEKLNELAEKYGDVNCKFGELNWPINDKEFNLAIVYKAQDKHNDKDRVYLYASTNNSSDILNVAKHLKKISDFYFNKNKITNIYKQFRYMDEYYNDK